MKYGGEIVYKGAKRGSEGALPHITYYYYILY